MQPGKCTATRPEAVLPIHLPQGDNMFRTKRFLIPCLALVASATVFFLTHPGDAKAHEECAPNISGGPDNPRVRLLARDSDGIGHDRR